MLFLFIFFLKFFFSERTYQVSKLHLRFPVIAVQWSRYIHFHQDYWPTLFRNQKEPYCFWGKEKRCRTNFDFQDRKSTDWKKKTNKHKVKKKRQTWKKKKYLWFTTTRSISTERGIWNVVCIGCIPLSICTCCYDCIVIVNQRCNLTVYTHTNWCNMIWITPCWIDIYFSFLYLICFIFIFISFSFFFFIHYFFTK